MNKSVTAGILAAAAVASVAIHLTSNDQSSTASPAQLSAEPTVAGGAPPIARQVSPANADDRTPSNRSTASASGEAAHVQSPGCGCSGCSSSGTALANHSTATAPVLITDQQRAQWMSLRAGDPITITLPGGIQATGTVEHTFQQDGETVTVQGAITSPDGGRFVLRNETMGGVAGEMTGNVVFAKSDLAYTVQPSADGSPELVESHVDGVICRHYATEYSAIQPPEEVTPEDYPADPAIPGYQNGVVPLSSLPGATGVVYLDFDGEDGPHESWGNFDALPSGMSNAQIREVWERVSEDFGPFNLNVTTDLAVFEAAQQTNRMRCIVTPTNDAAPGAGGVAFLRSFNWSGNTPCWVFIRSSKNCAEAASHEVGHTLGLTHDGDSTRGYYTGHGSGDVGWAPIMGVGYYKNLSQWSKGEYNDANQFQDDLQMITNNNNNVAYRTDDHGNTLATASHLEVLADDSLASDGVIETSADSDGFKFTLTASATVTLNVSALNHGPNLDILAELVDHTGAVAASDNPDTGHDASITTALTAGDYFLRVSGVGRGDVLGDGYSDYGSLGFYEVTGSVPNAVAPDRFQIAENPSANAPVGSVTPNNNHGADPLVYSITDGNSSGAFAIDPSSGALTVADTSQFNFEALSPTYLDPATFDLTVSITNATTPSLDESVRVVVEVTDVNEGPTIAPLASLTILDGFPIGTNLLSLTATDPDQFDALTFSITSGNTGDVFAIDPSTNALSVNGTFDPAGTPSYTLTITVSDTGTPALTDSTTITVNLVDIPDGFTPGSINQAYYHGISGGNVSDLTGSATFPNFPDALIARSEFASSSYGGSYGSVFRGYVIPTVTGSYTFWVAADDSAELFLSTTADPANVSSIASTASWTNEQSWDQYSSQQSAAVTLTAGQPYYVEMRFKEGGGGDHGAVAWQGPGITRQVIPGTNLAPYDHNFGPAIDSSTFAVQSAAYAGATVGTVTTTDLNTGDSSGQFAITGGNTGGAFTIDPTTGILTVANRDALTNGASFNLTVQATDNGVPAITGSGTVTVNINDVSLAAGTITLETWNNISGSSVADLTTHVNYPDAPDTTQFLSSFATAVDTANSYGARARGYIIPPTTGAYTFYIASDDNGSLLLSTDDTAGNASQIASVGDWTSVNQWDKYASQTSTAVNLVAGERYYIEALVKEGGGGDHLEVAWTGPGIAAITVIDGAYLEPYESNASPTWDAAPYTFASSVTAQSADAVGAVSATDPTGDPLLYTILSGNNSGAFAINPQTGAITVANPASITLIQYTLTVGAQDDGKNGVFPLASTTTVVTVNVPDANPDSDGDQMADLYELTHFGAVTTSDGTGDTDGDGQSDLAEFEAATIPTSAADVLEIISVTPTASDATVRWATKSGVTYRIEYSYDLSDWAPAATGQAGTGAAVDYVDTDATRAAAAQVFYRVVVE